MLQNFVEDLPSGCLRGVTNPRSGKPPLISQKKRKEKEKKKEKEVDPEEAERSRRFGEHFNYLVEGLERDPTFLDQPAEPGKFGYYPKETQPNPPDPNGENVSPSESGFGICFALLSSRGIS